MVEQGSKTAVFCPPSRERLSTWMISSADELSEELIKNSWQHSEFSYFPNEGEGGSDNDSENENGNDYSNNENESNKSINDVKSAVAV